MPPRRQKSFLLPLALGATAAAASLALWYFLSEDEQAERRQHTGHESGDERPRARGREPRDPSNRDSASSRDLRADFNASPREVRGPSTPSNLRAPRTPEPAYKKNICLVLSESSTPSSLLSHIPSPLALDRVNIYILVYSPSMTSHPLSPSGPSGVDSIRDPSRLVYNAARGLIPADKPAEVVMPYTSELSLVAMLKQLRPETVYMEAKLVGEGASVISGVLEGAWVGGVIIAVEDSLTGQRLADETGMYGKRCRVLDVDKAGEDWGLKVG